MNLEITAFLSSITSFWFGHERICTGRTHQTNFNPSTKSSLFLFLPFFIRYWKKWMKIYVYRSYQTSSFKVLSIFIFACVSFLWFCFIFAQEWTNSELSGHRFSHKFYVLSFTKQTFFHLLSQRNVYGNQITQNINISCLFTVKFSEHRAAYFVETLFVFPYRKLVARS